MMAIDYQRLFEALSSPYMIIDRDYRYVAVNSAYETAVMRRREDLIARCLFDEFPNPGESGTRLRNSFDSVFETGRADTLAYIRYEIPRPAEQGGGMEQRYWTAVHMPLHDVDGNLSFLIQNTVDVTDIVRLREAASLPFSAHSGETKLLERAREAEAQHQLLMAESTEFRRLFQQAPGFFAVLSGPEHTFTFANDAYLRLVGGRSVVGKTVGEALPEIVGQGFIEMLNGVYQTGEPMAGEAVRLMLQRAPDEAPRETFLDFSYDAIRDRDGTVTGIFVQGMDRTEAVKTQRRQRLLLDELNHRVKNTLATVLSIASQTMRAATDLTAARRDVEARIVALSNAHNLLSAREWSSASLRAIMSAEFEPLGTERARATGPEIVLSPKASIAVAMIIHELATNSLKYGALSVEDGRVDVGWALQERILLLDWTESGGPPTRTPERRGFGSRMIENLVRGELGGEFSPVYGVDGFACRIAIDAAAIVDERSNGIDVG